MPYSPSGSIASQTLVHGSGCAQPVTMLLRAGTLLRACAAAVMRARVPGRVFAGRVEQVMMATGTAQMAPSGQLPVLTGQPSTGRYPVLIALDHPDIDSLLPQGVGGTVAVYTQGGKPVHIITKVAMRIQA